MVNLTIGSFVTNSESFWKKRHGGGIVIGQSQHKNNQRVRSKLFDSNDGFDFDGKIESTKSGIVGLLAGGIGLAPFSGIHDIFIGGDNVVNGLAQWEFDTDMGSIEGALFAIVYRYCIRTDSNPMLNQGCIGAFVLVRVLSKIQIPSYCSAAPLDCGSPLGYFDWNTLTQASLAGIESVALFGSVALAMNYCFSNRFISKFRS